MNCDLFIFPSYGLNKKRAKLLCQKGRETKERRKHEKSRARSSLRLNKERMSLARFRLLVEYHGANYSGYQLQRGSPKNVRTVQGALASALGDLNMLGRVARMSVAGRTDSGVHALAQCVSIDVEPRGGREPLRGTQLRDSVLRGGAHTCPEGGRCRRLGGCQMEKQALVRADGNLVSPRSH